MKPYSTFSFFLILFVPYVIGSSSQGKLNSFILVLKLNLKKVSSEGKNKRRNSFYLFLLYLRHYSIAHFFRCKLLKRSWLHSCWRQKYRKKSIWLSLSFFSEEFVTTLGKLYRSLCKFDLLQNVIQKGKLKENR